MTNLELSCYTKLPHETNDSFQEFIKVRDLPPHKRTLRKVAENNLKQKGLTNTDKNYQNELKKELSRLTTKSAKWLWQQRFEIYDLDKQMELMQKQDDTFYGMNKALLDIVEGLVKYANNLLAELINGNAHKKNGEEFSLGTKIKMLNEITSVIRSANELLCQLCGRPSDYTKMELGGLIDVNAKVTGDLTLAEEEAKADEYFKQLEKEMQ